VRRKEKGKKEKEGDEKTQKIKWRSKQNKLTRNKEMTKAKRNGSQKREGKNRKSRRGGSSESRRGIRKSQWIKGKGRKNSLGTLL
jgi:hypothetical protein